MGFVTNHEYTVIRVKVLNEPRENKNESVFYNKSDNHTVTKVKVLDVYKPGKSKVKKNDTIKIVENYYIDAWDGELIIQYPRPYMLTPILESNKEYILFIEPYNFSYYNELDENLEDKEKWYSLAIQGAYLISSSKNILPCMEMEEYKAILKGIKKEFLNES